MSQYTTSFLLLNLGSEMLFVISQRLLAQNISEDRATYVLDEITSSLINQQLITELLNVPEQYNHDTMKQLINDIAQSSIMRLDSVSMDRLWDLITMVFKWQATLSEDIISVTMRHLYEIETFTTNPETQLQLHRVQNVVDNCQKVLTTEEKLDLTHTISTWLQDFNIRVSLLLRLGFQNQDGSFKRNEFDPKYTRMLENIGENIYAVTKTCNLTKSNDSRAQSGKNVKHELNTMINQILGNDDKQNKNTGEDAQFFKLSLCETYEEINSESHENENIYSEINISSTGNMLQDLFHVTSDEDTTDTNLHDELLNIIDGNC